MLGSAEIAEYHAAKEMNMVNHGGAMPDGWDHAGVVRSDGVRIEQTFSNTWVVRPPRGPDGNRCPCCQQVMQTKKAARIVADQMYPLGETMW